MWGGSAPKKCSGGPWGLACRLFLTNWVEGPMQRSKDTMLLASCCAGMHTEHSDCGKPLGLSLTMLTGLRNAHIHASHVP